jgi:hypothetical protein
LNKIVKKIEGVQSSKGNKKVTKAEKSDTINLSRESNL